MTRPKLTGQTPNNDIYLLPGDIPIHVQVIGLWTGMPPTILAGCRARRAASVTGECPLCPFHDRIHDVNCLAGDQALTAGLAQWERYTPKFRRGDRITEDPTNTVSIEIYERAAAIGDRQGPP